MRIATTLLLSLTYVSQAQVPAQDSRNVTVIDSDTHFAPPSFKSRAEWEARAARLRKQIQFAAGLLPMPEKAPINAQVFGRLERKGYTVEKVLLETMPGFYLGGNLYRPAGRSTPFPAIVSPHGHWAYGRLENSATGSIPARCINLARQGYVVFSYDMIGYDDTMQMPHVATGKREQLWGFGLLGMQLWDSIRAVDFLESLPDVDRERIGATGASGGATQILMLQAIDPRIKFSAPVNMISSIYQGGSPCENAPLLRIGTNNMELAALMAPRPMLMVSTTQDWTKNTPQIEYPAMKAMYRLYDKEANVETIQIDAPHNYNRDSREAVYRFFAKTVLGGDPQSPDFAEKGFTPEKPNDLMVLFDRTLPKNALTYAQLVEQWITNAQRQNTDAPDKERLMLALAAEWPEKVFDQSNGGNIVLSRGTDRVVGALHEGAKPATLLVDADNPDALQASLKINVFQTGSSVAPRDRSHPMFLTFNKTDDAERVQDILTALRWLNQDSTKLVCRGKASIWCTLAAAVSPKKVQLDAPVPPLFKGSDQDWIDYMFIPSIQRAGGWPAVLKLAR
ncbi:MAG TPA: acetylxylan esterase [Bryobacteraceae bacterium]|nr:acetylxylan esterase [Bryobacteraceae bacterium]